MADKIQNVEPIAVTNSASNLFNCALTSAAGGVNCALTQPKAIIRRITAVNKTNASHTITLYKGATGASAAGTEFIWNGSIVPANSSISQPMAARFDSTDFLTGLADANTAIVLNIDAEIGFSG